MWMLQPLSFQDLAGWAADDHASALDAFARHAERPAGEVYRHGGAGVSPQSLDPLFLRARDVEARSDPRSFFERNFDLFAIVSADGARGLVTAFYEPEIEASREPVAPFLTPFYRRPDDLVSVSDANRPNGWDPEIRFGRRSEDGEISAYPDRSAINAGYLDGRGLELAWVENPVDAFFAHVQGAARLKLRDGSTMRITYDGKSGHPFTAIGRLLVERGQIALADVSMATIRAWLAAHPGKARALMEQNRSYIFFREASAGRAGDGPVAAAKVPLTAERSLAVDRLQHTFGTPVFVHADNVDGGPWAKLMIAQDTGSAIVGAARGDLFMGSGDVAGDRAGGVRSCADVHILAPKSLRLEPGRQVTP